MVPAASLHAIARACFVPEPTFGPVAARIRLLRVYEELGELQLAGVAAGIAPVAEAVRFALDTAAIAAEATSGADELVSAAWSLEIWTSALQGSLAAVMIAAADSSRGCSYFLLRQEGF